ncbi:uncharacterized protein LOC118766632 [Octopus sinensis]|uniref:Uncharacterized protein LOC118766632 n=1 Tax=Octopus sinensis TaxID=2607531 RepID=A0A7E6FEA0_9MOLL|nr:uncharacterized protein LOC118766632 [Octopus sinensis]
MLCKTFHAHINVEFNDENKAALRSGSSHVQGRHNRTRLHSSPLELRMLPSADLTSCHYVTNFLRRPSHNGRQLMWHFQRILFQTDTDDQYDNALGEASLCRFPYKLRQHFTIMQLPSQDTVTDLDQVTHFPTEFLNSQDPPLLPPHELHLNVSCLVILLSNLNASTLCNGTRLEIKQIMDQDIEAQIITGHGKNNTVFIPKVPLTPTDCPYPMQSLQSPLKLSFTMTINKEQGPSLKIVGLDLRTSCFSHGQFYVGCSRVGHPVN